MFALGRNELDLSVPDQIRKQVRKIAPELIINAAAYTAVDEAEKEPDLAMAVNGVAPGILAEEAKSLGAPLIHYSTDYVFDGKKTEPYTEEDAPHPINVYGTTKLAGERAIQSVGQVHLIFRTGWVYGLRRKNFLLTMQGLAREKKEIRVVDDQTGAPTWCRSIAEATTHVLSKFLKGGAEGGVSALEEKSGIYNMTCTGQTNWYDFAKSIFDRQPLENRPTLAPISTEEYPTAARRPQNTVLLPHKLEKTFEVVCPFWEDGLKSCLQTTSGGGP